MSWHRHIFRVGPLPLVVLLSALILLQCKGEKEEEKPVTYDPKASANERKEAVRNLKDAGDKSSIATLIEAAQGDDADDIRELAVVSLGHLGAVEAIATLANAARQDRNYHIRRRAVQSLGKIHDSQSSDILATLWATSASPEDGVFNLEVHEAFVALGAIALPGLRKSLHHESYRVRWKAVQALAKIGDPAALDDLRALADDPNPTVQDAVTDAIDALGAKKTQ